MSTDDMTELMELKGWNRTALAGMLHVTPDAVRKWYERGEVADGPAVILMRIWLDQARDGKKVGSKK